ncbi:DUF835 domain-containing protein [Candidatus Altiarchaeota archaeon]
MLEKEASYHYNKESYEVALKKYLKVLEISIELHQDGDIGKYHDLVGDCYERLEHHKKEEMLKDHVKASAHYIKSAKNYLDINKPQKAAEVFEKGAKSLEELEEYGKAADVYKKAAQIFIEIKDFFSGSFAYHKSAEYFEKNNDYEKAAKTNLEAALIDMKLKDTPSASICFKQAAKNFEQVKMWKRAIDAYADVVEIDSLGRRYLEVADSYERMAEAYKQTKDTDNSIYYHLKAAEIRINNKDIGNAAYCLNQAAMIYEDLDNKEDAIKYYLKAAELYYKSQNMPQSATSFMSAGEVYEESGEYWNAGNTFTEASKTAEIEGKAKLIANGYQNAARVYALHAEAMIEKEEYEKAGEPLIKSAESFDAMKDYEMAATKYTQYAKLMKVLGKEEESRKGFGLAAEEYEKSGRIWDAAESRYYTQEYDNSAKAFLEYSKNMEKEKDNYSAAAGYLYTSRAYNKSGNRALKKQYDIKAVMLLTKYIEEEAGEPKTEDDYIHIGDARRMVAESHQELLDYREAERQYAKALELYEKTKDKNRRNVTKSLLLKMQAEHAIDHGYYPKASGYLDEAEKLMKDSIDNGGWKLIYLDFLDDNSLRIQELKDIIMMKPTVVLDVDQRSYTFANIPLILNIILTNNGQYTMKKISFLEHLPEHISLFRLPKEIASLDPGKSHKGSIELKPLKTGFHRIKPIEVYYEDQEGHKYVKASNEVSLEVVEQPETDYKNYRKAEDIHLKYAKSQQDNKNWFHAADGYRQAADIHGRFKTDEIFKEYHLKTLDNYERYAAEHDKEDEDPVKLKRLADCLWYAGESSRILERTDEAVKNYEKSSHYYLACEQPALSDRSLANKRKVEGIKAIKVGEYETAASILTASLEYFNNVVKTGDIPVEDIKEIEKSEDEIKALLKNIKGKPEIKVELKGPDKSKTGETIEYTVKIINPQKFTIKDIRPTLKQNKDLTIVRRPDIIGSIDAGKEVEVSFQVKTKKAGEYKFNPLDVSYTDDKNNSFMRGGNEVTLEVSSEKVEVGEEGKIPEGDVILDVDQSSYVIIGYRTVFNATLENKTSDILREVSFLTNVPNELKVDSVPEKISQMRQGEKIDVRVELTPTKAGKYRIRPLEVFYRDPAGHKYVKASSEVGIEVVKAPEKDYNNYTKAVDIIIKYAKNQMENKNWYHAGRGYHEVAETYGRFNSDDTLKGYYELAIENYARYGSENEDSSDKTIVDRVRDSLWYSGICLMVLGRSKTAREQLTESLKHHDEEDMVNVVTAFITQLDARIAIEHGEYDKAGEYLKTSVKQFSDCIRNGSYDPEFTETLEKMQKEVELMLDNLQAKPEILVKVEAPQEVACGKPFIIEATLSNMSTRHVSDITTEPSLPDGMKINKNPEPVKEIQPGNTTKTFMEIVITREDKYIFRPFNIKYSDNTGKNYMQGTSEISIISARTEKKDAGEQAKEKPERPSPEGKPQIELEVMDPPQGETNKPMTIHAVVSNTGDIEVNGLRFIGNPKDGFGQGESPPTIEKLKPGQKKEFTHTFTPTIEGTHQYNPLEMFYKDPQSNRYFKSSNQITVKVQKQMTKDGRPLAELDAGSSYIIEGNDALLALTLFERQVSQGYNGLIITRKNPDQILKDHQLENTRFLWISDTSGESRYKTVSNPQDISIQISEFMEEHEKTMILLEGLEYIINTSGFSITLEFIQFNRDRNSTKDSVFMIQANPDTLDPKQLERLKHECIIYAK